jgi:hypothetical protein
MGKTEVFIAKAKLVHGDTYDYSRVEYDNAKSNVSIICREHGVFEQAPTNHLSGAGCTKCSHRRTSARCKDTTEIFISKAKATHREKYSYRKVEYSNSLTAVTITCPIHGDFNQRPANHVKGSGCPVCGELQSFETRKIGLEGFLTAARSRHGDTYDYSKTEYHLVKSKLKITCRLHGDFTQTAEAHMNGSGCPKCGDVRSANAKRYDNDEYVAQARIVHGDTYGYEELDYKDSQLKIRITCPTHGVFEQQANCHLQGGGCPSCAHNGPSKSERELFSFVESVEPNITSSNRSEIAPFELDIFLPEQRIAIEYHGLYWHSDIYRENNYHLDKLEKCKHKGIDLIQVFEDEWLFKRDIVKSIISTRLGAIYDTVFARKTTRVMVTAEDARQFYDSNHIQGFAGAEQHYGLIVKGEIVAMASFSRPRAILTKNAKQELELIRFCTKINTRVIGGLSKLMAAVKGKTILTYCDRRLFNAEGYKSVGFNEIRTSDPAYFYTKGLKRYSRFKFQKHKLNRALESFDPAKTEVENMKDNGYYRVFDCGNTVLELNPN